VSRVRLIGRPSPHPAPFVGVMCEESPLRKRIDAMKVRRREWLPTGRVRVLWFVAVAVLLVWLVLLLVGFATTR
jgi:hypothetical protein